jgi:hypothetical protein
VRTFHRVGYAFCGVIDESATTALPSLWPQCWLISDTRHIPLHQGENILGREPDATVRIDGATVSRRHARIVITANNATLDDLGSKNGTYLRGIPVTVDSPLVDGDEIHLGSCRVTFRMTSGAGSTATQGSRDD